MCNSMTGYTYYLLSLLFYIFLITMAYDVNTESISVAAWNMRCNTSISQDYLRKLATVSDIIAVSEHGLFECELHKLNALIPGYHSIGKSSKQLCNVQVGSRQGTGGCAILWNTEKFKYKIRPLPNLGTDRSVVLEINTGCEKYFVVSVYMPHQTCRISNYKAELDQLQWILNECMPHGRCIIVGDFNAHFSQSYGVRCWGTSNSNAPKLNMFVNSNEMNIVDLGPIADGPQWTYSGYHGNTYIDHMVVQSSMVQHIESCTVLSDDICQTILHCYSNSPL